MNDYRFPTKIWNRNSKRLAHKEGIIVKKSQQVKEAHAHQTATYVEDLLRSILKQKAKARAEAIFKSAIATGGHFRRNDGGVTKDQDLTIEHFDFYFRCPENGDGDHNKDHPTATNKGTQEGADDLNDDDQSEDSSDSESDDDDEDEEDDDHDSQKESHRRKSTIPKTQGSALLQTDNSRNENATGEKLDLTDYGMLAHVVKNKNITVTDVAEGLRNADYVGDYFRGIQIPCGKSDLAELQTTDSYLLRIKQMDRTQNKMIKKNNKDTTLKNSSRGSRSKGLLSITDMVAQLDDQLSSEATFKLLKSAAKSPFFDLDNYNNKDPNKKQTTRPSKKKKKKQQEHVEEEKEEEELEHSKRAETTTSNHDSELTFDTSEEDPETTSKKVHKKRGSVVQNKTHEDSSNDDDDEQSLPPASKRKRNTTRKTNPAPSSVSKKSKKTEKETKTRKRKRAEKEEEEEEDDVIMTPVTKKSKTSRASNKSSNNSGEKKKKSKKKTK